MRIVLSIIGLLLLPSTALAYPASMFEEPLELSERLNLGLRDDVRESQGLVNLQRLLESSAYGETQKSRFRAMFEKRVDRNMKAIRNVVRCSDSPRDCVSRRPLSERF